MYGLMLKVRPCAIERHTASGARITLLAIRLAASPSEDAPEVLCDGASSSVVAVAAIAGNYEVACVTGALCGWPSTATADMSAALALLAGVIVKRV